MQRSGPNCTAEVLANGAEQSVHPLGVENDIGAVACFRFALVPQKTSYCPVLPGRLGLGQHVSLKRMEGIVWSPLEKCGSKLGAHYDPNCHIRTKCCHPVSDQRPGPTPAPPYALSGSFAGSHSLVDVYIIRRLWFVGVGSPGKFWTTPVMFDWPARM